MTLDMAQQRHMGRCNKRSHRMRARLSSVAARRTSFRTLSILASMDLHHSMPNAAFSLRE